MYLEDMNHNNFASKKNMLIKNFQLLYPTLSSFCLHNPLPENIQPC